MYNTVIKVNNTVGYYLTAAKSTDLKSSHHKKKIVTVCGDGCSLDLLW